mgnify:CR=1 FL=1
MSVQAEFNQVEKKVKKRRRRRKVREKKVRTELGYTVYYVCPRCGREYHDPRDAENCACQEYEELVEQNERLRRKLAYTKALLERSRTQPTNNLESQMIKPEIFAESPKVVDINKIMEKQAERRGNKIEKALVKVRTLSIPSWIALAIVSIILSLIFLLISGHSLVMMFVSIPFLMVSGICLFFAASDMLFPQPPAYVSENFEIEVEKPYGRVKLYVYGDPRPFIEEG